MEVERDHRGVGGGGGGGGGGRTCELWPWKEEESERDGGRTEKGEEKVMGRE